MSKPLTPKEAAELAAQVARVEAEMATSDYAVMDANGNITTYKIIPDTRPWIVRFIVHLFTWRKRRKARRQVEESRRLVLAAMEETKQSMLHTYESAKQLLDSLDNPSPPFDPLLPASRLPE